MPILGIPRTMSYWYGSVESESNLHMIIQIGKIRVGVVILRKLEVSLIKGWEVRVWSG